MTFTHMNTSMCKWLLNNCCSLLVEWQHNCSMYMRWPVADLQRAYRLKDLSLSKMQKDFWIKNDTIFGKLKIDHLQFTENCVIFNSKIFLRQQKKKVIQMSFHFSMKYPLPNERNSPLEAKLLLCLEQVKQMWSAVKQIVTECATDFLTIS